MADIKWSAFPSIGNLATGDVLVGLRAGANVRFSALTIPWTVPNGGTGLTTATAYALLAGGTTATGAFQSLGTGTAGQMLQSGGASALPTWTTATFPSVAGAAGTILRSNGTDWVASTSTFADTYATHTLLYSNGANTVTGLATAATGMLVTNVSGIPSIGNALLADFSFNSVRIGRGNSSLATNTVVGSGAGSSYTSGNHNTSVGYSSLDAVTIGANNVGYGYLSGVSGATGAVTLVTGSANTFLGYRASSNSSSASDTIAIGADAVASAATGGTSSDNGPGIAFGSDAHRVGFTGDGTIYTGGTGRGYWRPTINGVPYLMPLFIDGTLTASAGMVTDNNGSPILTSAMTDGQLIIGTTSGTPTAATLTAGDGVFITNGAGSITIATTGGGLPWSTIAGTTQSAAVNNGYVIGNASQTTVTLPATAAVGSVVAVAGQGAGGFILAANTGQTIKFATSTTTSGGSLTSAEQYDYIQVVCIVANTTWLVQSAISTGFTPA